MNVKKYLNTFMIFALLFTSLVVSKPVQAKAPAKFNLQDANYVPGEAVVVFANSRGKSLVNKLTQAIQTAQASNGEVTRLSQDGTAVIKVNGDFEGTLNALNARADVLYAEPNYIFSLPEVKSSSEGYKLNSEYVFRQVTPSAATNYMKTLATPKTAIQSLVGQSVYPTDVYLLDNNGWGMVGADIVWPNTTASAGVCVIDTGVDALHPDLKAKMLSGYDFVNVDTLPADDNGHGTHVAGIIGASQNNAIGIAGVSTGKIAPVKALDAQGVGTNFDVAKAIVYCAGRADIRVINLSLGSLTSSTAIYDALLLATTPVGSNVPVPGGAIGGSGVYAGQPGKGKLVIAAAGNDNSSTPVYPAYYASESEFTDRILAVGASGQDDVSGYDYTCRADFSNYGSWVSVVAPGNSIYSTTPYDKPFFQNNNGVDTRYSNMSGTSMAAGFVSGAAARRMGYKTLETSTQVGTAVRTLGFTLDTATVGCWDASMSGKVQVNVAKLLERAAIKTGVFDAVTGTPLFKAKVVAYGNNAIKGSALMPAAAYTKLPGEDPDPKRIFTYYQTTTEILNLPTVGLTYTLKVNLATHTVGDQPAFQHVAATTLTSGEFVILSDGAVPPKSAYLDVVAGWQVWQQPGFEEATDPYDLDLYLWLPAGTNPANFIVGFAGDSFGYLENDPYGTLNAFPFARLRREGGYLDDDATVESIAILKNPTNAALPYYPGNYTVMVTDYGQTIDHDGDGCGNNYGATYTYNYVPGAECAGKTLGIALLGSYYTPHVYVWKDGLVKYFQNSANNFGPWAEEVNTDNPATCNDHWWKAFTIGSSATAPVFTAFNNGTPGVPLCDDGDNSLANFIPYTGYTNPNDAADRITLLNK